MERRAAELFPTIESLDRTDFPARMAVVLRAGQAEAVRATGGYLTAFLTSELQRFTSGPGVESTRYAGFSRDGRPLSEALQSPVIGTLAKLSEGATPDEAIAYGRNRAVRMVETDLMHAARQALADGMDTAPQITGWRRAVAGTCGACLGAGEAGEQGAGDLIETHPNCQCVSEPVVRGTVDRVSRPSAAEVFAAMSTAEQNKNFGESTAAALRDGDVGFEELVKRVPQKKGPDYITQEVISPPKTQEV